MRSFMTSAIGGRAPADLLDLQTQNTGPEPQWVQPLLGMPPAIENSIPGTNVGEVLTAARYLAETLRNAHCCAAGAEDLTISGRRRRPGSS